MGTNSEAIAAERQEGIVKSASAEVVRHTTEMLALLKASFPNQLRGLSKRDGQMMVIAWAIAFERENPADVRTAIDAIRMQRSKDAVFFPSLPAVLAEIDQAKDRREAPERARRDFERMQNLIAKMESSQTDETEDL
ncbi:MAG: hypothetical protein LBN00_06500 [Oscillospiraceae bacterium]|jgi:hypothetical protein|nr:hypothetical protein [Oscillospiraceae bacterium]